MTLSLSSTSAPTRSPAGAGSSAPAGLQEHLPHLLVDALALSRPLETHLLAPRMAHRISIRTAPHGGVDYAVPVGTQVHAPFTGVVAVAGNVRGFGNTVVIQYPQGSVILGHLSSISVRVGMEVQAGTVVALSGNTGSSTGPHLHQEQHGSGPYFGPNNRVPPCLP